MPSALTQPVRICAPQREDEAGRETAETLRDLPAVSEGGLGVTYDAVAGGTFVREWNGKRGPTHRVFRQSRRVLPRLSG